jgi:uncharacterized membrane protein
VPIALVAIGWATLILATPFLAAESTGADLRFRAATLAYIAGSFICHQRPERSFEAFGLPLPVCGRCTGIYLGAALAAAATLFVPRGRLFRMPHAYARWRAILIVAALPIVLSLAAEWFTRIPVSNLARAATGIIAGAAVAACLTSLPLGQPEPLRTHEVN